MSKITATELQDVKPVALRVPGAVKYTGLSRSALYELMADGRLPFTSVGTARLILVRHLDELIGAVTLEELMESAPGEQNAAQKLAHLADLARAVRRLQKLYFAKRNPATLGESKDAERRLDAYLDSLDGVAGDLFGGER